MLIGLIGKSNSGKDTTFELINKNSTLLFENVKFAGVLKNTLATLFNTPVDEFENRTFKEVKIYKDKSVRYMLEYFGAAGRKIDESFWVDMAMKNILPHKNYCFTDVRYPNEGLAIKEKGGILIRINRPQTDYNTLMSERFINEIPIDYVLDNSKTVSYLEEQVRAILEDYNTEILLK